MHGLKSVPLAALSGLRRGWLLAHGFVEVVRSDLEVLDVLGFRLIGGAVVEDFLRFEWR